MVYSYTVHGIFNVLSSLMLVKTISQFIFTIIKLRFREVHPESKCTVIDSSTHQIIAKFA